MKFDLVVIGSGPAGYVAAIAAAKKGMKVACVEKDPTFGGTCLNVGCIPSKALLHSTEYFHKVAEQGEEHGIIASNLSVDLAKMMQRKEKVVQSLTQGIDFLFRKNKVTPIVGRATLKGSGQVQVNEQTLEAEKIILAMGSEPIGLPFLPFDEKRVLSSTGALSLPEIPKKMLIVGAGVIGLELGSVYHRMGSEIEVVELLDRVIPTFDADLSKEALHIFKKERFNFHLSTKVTAAKIEPTGVELQLGERSLTGDVVLISIGRKPYSQGLKDVGIELDSQGRVVVDGTFQTSLPGVYAIGDLIDGAMLAHKASDEAIALVEHLAYEKSSLNYVAIPNVMYTWPEVAAVGLTEEEAKETGREILVGKFSFKATPRARASGDEQGLVKIVADKKTGRLLGMHIIGPQASEMIGEGVVAIEKKMTVQELAHASHAHPTCSEAIKEAAFAAYDQPLHS